MAYFLRKVEALLPDYSHVFTGGSELRDPSRAGCAFFCATSKIVYEIPLFPEVSVSSAELFAIISAISFCVNRGLNKVAIFSDSLAAVVSIKGRLYKTSYSYLVYKIGVMCRWAAQRGIRISIEWNPSHFGIRGKHDN